MWVQWSYRGLIVEAGQRIADKYELIQLVGEGGMGEVWAAHHAQIDRHVAIKFPSSDLVKRPEIRERFLAEARVLGRLRHPNIVDVLDFGELPDDGLFLVFELLDGTSLDAYIQDMGRLPARSAVRIAIELCRGLVFAHEAKVIHRDLKPANVFLHKAPDGRMLVKILDFGISKTCSLDGDQCVSLTATNTAIGTPAYMSYEQAKALSDIDARSDLWNVGVILYEMVSGLPPFEARTYSATVAKIVSESVAPMSTWGAVVPVELETIVQRCLAKDRDKRFQSGRALQTALEGVLMRCSEPPVSRRLQLDSLADLPTMPPPAELVVGPASSSSLRLYSPCAVTVDGAPSVSASSGESPASPSSHPSVPVSSPPAAGPSRRWVLLAGAVAMLAAGAGLASLVSHALSSPQGDALEVQAPASGMVMQSAAVPSEPPAEPPVVPAETASSELDPVVVPVPDEPPSAPVASKTTPRVVPTRTSKPRPARSSDDTEEKPPTTLVDDPGF